MDGPYSSGAKSMKGSRDNFNTVWLVQTEGCTQCGKGEERTPLPLQGGMIRKTTAKKGI